MQKKNWVKIFERAYDKCAALQAGQDTNLTAYEEYILQYAMDRRRLRVRHFYAKQRMV